MKTRREARTPSAGGRASGRIGCHERVGSSLPAKGNPAPSRSPGAACPHPSGLLYWAGLDTSGSELVLRCHPDVASFSEGDASKPGPAANSESGECTAASVRSPALDDQTPGWPEHSPHTPSYPPVMAPGPVGSTVRLEPGGSPPSGCLPWARLPRAGCRGPRNPEAWQRS